MRKPGIDIGIVSLKSWESTDLAERFYELLMSFQGVFMPDKMGRYEPLRTPFTYANLLELWQPETKSSTSNNLLLGRKGGSFYSLSWGRTEKWRFNDLSFHLHQREITKVDSMVLIRFLKEIVSIFRGVYGFICHDGDFDEQTLVTQKGPYGTNLLGSGFDIRKYVPGVYWANVFGVEYATFWGKQKLLSAPAYRVEELPSGGVLIVAYEDPLAYDSPAAREARERIKDHIGREYFFDKFDPKPCPTPPFDFSELRPKSGGDASAEPNETHLGDEFTPDAEAFVREVHSLAARVAEQGSLGGFTLDDLTQVQRMIRKLAAKRDWPEAGDREKVREFAAYFGEMLRTNLGGRWVIAVDRQGKKMPAVELRQGNEIEYPLVRVLKYWTDRTSGLVEWYQLLASGALVEIEKGLGGPRETETYRVGDMIYIREK